MRLVGEVSGETFSIDSSLTDDNKYFIGNSPDSFIHQENEDCETVHAFLTTGGFEESSLLLVAVCNGVKINEISAALDSKSIIRSGDRISIHGETYKLENGFPIAQEGTDNGFFDTESIYMEERIEDIPIVTLLIPAAVPEVERIESNIIPRLSSPPLPCLDKENGETPIRIIVKERKKKKISSSAIGKRKTLEDSAPPPSKKRSKTSKSSKKMLTGKRRNEEMSDEDVIMLAAILKENPFHYFDNDVDTVSIAINITSYFPLLNCQAIKKVFSTAIIKDNLSAAAKQKNIFAISFFTGILFQKLSDLFPPADFLQLIDYSILSILFLGTKSYGPLQEIAMTVCKATFPPTHFRSFLGCNLLAVPRPSIEILEAQGNFITNCLIHTISRRKSFALFSVFLETSFLAQVLLEALRATHLHFQCQMIDTLYYAIKLLRKYPLKPYDKTVMDQIQIDLPQFLELVKRSRGEGSLTVSLKILQMIYQFLGFCGDYNRKIPRQISEIILLDITRMVSFSRQHVLLPHALCILKFFFRPSIPVEEVTFYLDQLLTRKEDWDPFLHSPPLQYFFKDLYDTIEGLPCLSPLQQQSLYKFFFVSGDSLPQNRCSLL